MCLANPKGLGPLSPFTTAKLRGWREVRLVNGADGKQYRWMKCGVAIPEIYWSQDTAEELLCRNFRLAIDGFVFPGWVPHNHLSGAYNQRMTFILDVYITFSERTWKK
jgi:hypothetical protein